MAKIASVRSTIDSNDIGYAFQAIVGLEGRETRHFELLSRIKGQRSPFEFITFAEDTGLIADVDFRSCRKAISYLNEYPILETLPLAVNLSSRSLQSEAFAVRLLALLDKHEEVRQRLKFEVTESARIVDFAKVESVIRDLRRRDFEVGLDDFGAGSNSFTTLYNLTIDFLKIDGAYVQRMMDSSRDKAMLRAMVGLASDFGVPTVAEMIEVEAQAEEARSLGVDLGQGYLFGRPNEVPVPTRGRSPQVSAVKDEAPRTRPRRVGSQQSWG